MQYTNNNTNDKKYPLATATAVVVPLPCPVEDEAMKTTKKHFNHGNYPLTTATAAVAPLPSPVEHEALKTTEKHFNHAMTTAEQQRTAESKEEANRIMKDQGFTKGLIESINRSNDVFPQRYWVIDNSGSMSMADGHRIYESNDRSIRFWNCTRWAEIQDTVSYHARMAAALRSPTSFRLLNPTCGKEMFGIAERGPEHIPEDLDTALRTMEEVSPTGVTPLSERVQEIGVTVKSMRDQLIANGHKAVIVLATDGLPSDRHGRSTMMERRKFKLTLRSLEGLPVWVVIRLCTDDDDIVDFYNSIDNELELSLDVLDDFVAEAQEVYEHNKWLNYALPLHRMREMGFYHKLFDLIDERALTRDELRDFFYLLYGADALDGLPDPHVHWDGFRDHIARLTRDTGLLYNPIKKRLTPWIDIRKLDGEFGGKFNCFSCF